MTTATATKKTKTPTIADTVTKRHQELKREALRKWRAWADAAAKRGELPDTIELLSVATMLGIQTPGEALEDDAKAIRQIETAERNAESCDAQTSKLLEPWDGNRQRIADAIAVAEAEIKKLRHLLVIVGDCCGRAQWATAAHRARKRNPRLFADVETVIAPRKEVEL